MSGWISRTRVRIVAWAYLALLIVSYWLFLNALTNPAQTSATNAAIDRVNLAGAVVGVLLLVGAVSVIVVSYLKRHKVAAVAGAIVFAIVIMFVVISVTDPEGAFILGLIVPLFLLLIVIFPVVGAIRRAQPGSPWAAYFLTTETRSCTPPTSE